MLVSTVSGISVMLLLVAAGLAVRLTALSERRAAWVFVSLSLVLMSCRQAVIFYNHTIIDTDETPTLAMALAELAISGFLAFGLLLIRSFLINLRKTRDELEEKEQQFRVFVENSPSEFTLKDLDGNYLFVNPQFLKGTDWQEGEHVGKSVFDALPQESAADALAREREAARNREVMHSESTVHIKGQDRTFLVTKFPVFGSDGSVQAVGSINTDITERVKAERALSEALNHAEKANIAKSNFLAMMSHEFRTPLNVMIGFSEVMKNELFGPLGTKRYREYAEDIHTSGAQMLELVDDILDLSAIEAGKKEIIRTETNLNTLVSDTVRRFQQQAGEKNIGVSTEYAPDLPVLLVDPRAVRQILENLISNAIKYTDEGGRIQVMTTQHQSDVTLMVVDTGIGIPEEKLATITEPFVRANNNAHISHSGTGLGLSIVKKNVESHGGVLEISSTVGLGTSVSVTFKTSKPKQVSS